MNLFNIKYLRINSLDKDSTLFMYNPSYKPFIHLTQVMFGRHL